MHLFTNGSKVIEGVFNAFEKQKEELRYGIQLCNTEISNKNKEIAKLEDEANAISVQGTRAEKLLLNLQKLTGDEAV